MRALVTGGAGFIGSHLVDRLVERDLEVVVLDNLDPQVHGEAAEAPPALARWVSLGKVTFIRGDIRDRATVDRALEDVDTVVHLAAAVGVGQSMYEPDYYTSVNDYGQGVLMAAMAAEPKRYGRFIVASSMSIYGEGAYRCTEHGRVAPPPRDPARLEKGAWEALCPECGREVEPVLTAEDKHLWPSSIYAITKKSQEDLALCFGGAYEIPAIALRFFNTFGSRQALSNPYTGVAAIFMGRLKNGRAPLIFEDGAQTRDFVHVSDVAESVVRSIDAPGSVSGAYNVCTGRPVSIRQVAEALADRMGDRTPPEIVGRYRAGDIRHCVGDPARARQELGFEATIPFEQGLDELMAWSEDAEATDRVEASMATLEEKGLVR